MPIHESLSEIVQSTSNRLHFALRNFLQWPVPPYYEPNFNKTLLFKNQPAVLEQAIRLQQDYDLSQVQQSASKTRYLETLTYLDWLDCFLNAEPASFQVLFQQFSLINWLDVGAKNWSYVSALTAFLQKHALDFELNGIELDPHRRYVDLTTRQQVAKTHIKQLEPQLQSKVHYQTGNALQWQQPTHVISHFLPFILKEPHLAWGLPLNTFKPETLLLHELSLLEPSGILLIVNQGEWEAEAQEALLTSATNHYPIRFQSLGQLPARFIQYQYPRYGWICIKNGTHINPRIPQ